MRAVVLVGGFGTRLRPLTNSVPKPMLPVGHIPIIQRLVANLVRGGVTHVTFALGFKPEPFIAAFPEGTCGGATLDYAVEPEPLDTAGAIRFAADFAGVDDTFVVANGDVLTDLDIASLIAFHRSHGAEATLHLTPVPDPSAFGVVDTDERGHVRRFVEKPPPGTAPSNLINAGTYVFDSSVLALIALGRKVSVEREIFPKLVERGRLWAMPTDDYWVDTGQPDLYLQANLDVINTRRSQHHRAVAIDPQAVIHPSAIIQSSVVSAGATVAANAVITNSVLLDGSVIYAGARVEHSVVMGKIGSGASIHHCVIGADGSVDASQVVADQRIPAPTI